jgi:hypothetical protein
MAETMSEPGRRRWDVFLPPGTATAAGVSVSTTAVGPTVVPSIRVRLGPGAEAGLDHTIRIDPETLALREPVGLRPVKFGEWRVADPDWHARLAAAESVKGLDGRAIPRGEVIVAREGTRWLYRGRYVVSAGETDRLSLIAPPGSRWREAIQNGVAVPHFNGPVRFPAIAGPRVLTLLWESDEPVWEAAQVRFDGIPLRLDGVDWTVVVPNGFHLAGEVWETPGPGSPIEFGDGWAEDREVFARGAPHRVRLPEGRAPDLHLERPPVSWVGWKLALTLGLWVAVAGLAVLWPHHTAPERAAGLGALAAITFGPAGAAFWLVGVVAAGRRACQLGRRVWAHRRATTPAREFLN